MSEKKLEKNTLSHSLHEECGVFGMYDLDGNDVASTIYYGLFALQHRGQESCGIAVSDTCGPKGKVTVHKDMGLVNEVFTQDILDSMKGVSASDMSAIPRREHPRGKTRSPWCSIM